MQRPWMIAVLFLTCLGVSAPVYAEIGTCLSPSGLLMAPWSDAVDPACGQDCGADGVLLEFPSADLVDPSPEAPCASDEENLCQLPDEPPSRALARASDSGDGPDLDPDGPRCDHEGPECQRRAPISSAQLALTDGGATAAAVTLATGRRRPPGRLPLLLGQPSTLGPYALSVAPPSPPPR